MLLGSALIRSKVFHSSTQLLRWAFPRGAVVSLRMGEQVFSTEGLIWCPFLFHALRTLGISLTVVMLQHLHRDPFNLLQTWMQISPSVSSSSPVGLLIAAECSYTQLTPSVLWFPTLLICCSRGDVINQQQRWHHVLSSLTVFLRLMWGSWWGPQLRFGDFLVQEGLSFFAVGGCQTNAPNLLERFWPTET